MSGFIKDWLRNFRVVMVAVGVVAGSLAVAVGLVLLDIWLFDKGYHVLGSLAIGLDVVIIAAVGSFLYTASEA